MSEHYWLRCLVCGQIYQPDEVAYVCRHHGNEGILDVLYDYEQIGQQFSRDQLRQNPDPTIWRYKPLLPVLPNASVPPLAVGGTPLYDASRLATRLGVKQVWVKDDGRNPTASLKDRASALAVVKAQEQGATVITTASTGNAAAALSGVCASVGMKNVIFVPASAPSAKIAQLLTYGCTVLLVQGSYDDAFELCLQAAAHYGWYNRNTGYNPYMTEGKKTVSYEICEQLSWQVPDSILVSVGDGCIIGGVHKGLKELLALGWINKMPRLLGVQASGSNFLAQAWEQNEDPFTKPPIFAHTVADSINAGLPRDRLKAMAAVRQTDGAFVTVTDDQILAAIPELARTTGVFAEPAGAAALAGLYAAIDKGWVSKDERVLLLITGNGLKDVPNAMKAVESAGTHPYTIQPTLQSLMSLQFTP